MATLKRMIQWRDTVAGVVQKVMPEKQRSSVPFAINMLFDEIFGEAVLRKGTTRIGSQLADNTTCRGIYQHVDTTFANSKLFANFSGTIYDVAAGTADLSVTGLTSTAQSEFATFLNNTIHLNGVSADARSYSALGVWISTGGVFDLANLPANAKHPIEYKDRLYVVVNDTLHYTNVVTAGEVSWTASGSGNIIVEQEDGGGSIQGLSKVPGYLMIYKQRSLKRWNASSAFPEDLVNIGTQSGRSIVSARGHNFFSYMPHGFFASNGNGFPTKISRPIQKIIDGIPSTNYDKIAGWSDNNHIYWSIGDVTVDFGHGLEEDYTNVVVRLAIDTQDWSILQYPHAFQEFTQYIDSNNGVNIVGGDDDGQVIQINSGTTDYNAQPIKYLLQSPEFHFTRHYQTKTLKNRIIVHSEGAEGGMVQVRVDHGDWDEIGSIKSRVSEIEIQKDFSGKTFEFRIVDSSTAEFLKITGIDFPPGSIDVHE